jgi:protoporphyrinogen oxidase
MSAVRVAVVGAGLAGLTAALRLLERGYEVAVYERKRYVGGKFGAHTHTAEEFRHRPYVGGVTYRPETYHEHCYHMFLNWYHNFWRLAGDIGLSRDRDFEPRTAVKHLRRGEFPRTTEIVNPGTVTAGWQNLFSGVRSVPDMFLYSFSILDLLAQRFGDSGLIDRYTVNGFLQSRPYATEGSADLHEHTLAKAFACPSYLTAARSYQAFAKYSLRLPDPMMWVLRGDCERHFNAPLRARLDALGCRWQLGREVRTVIHDAETGALTLESRPCANAELPHPPARPGQPEAGPDRAVDAFDYVILAVPPSAVRDFLKSNVALARQFVTQERGTIEKLHTEAIASLDLYLKRTVPGLPKEHVVLLDSRYGLTVVDNSQLWPGLATTCLNVAATDFEALAELPEDVVMREIVAELGNYLPVTHEDVDYWHIETNAGDELFLNEVGSEQWRPGARTPVPGLFLAGDYCQTFIDVVTIEGAVVSGLTAARALQEQVAADRAGAIGADDPLLRPIDIVEPEAYPRWMLFGLVTMLAPWAVAAKVWSDLEGSSSIPGVATPQAMTEGAAKLLWAPAQVAAQWWTGAWAAWAELARGGWAAWGGPGRGEPAAWGDPGRGGSASRRDA